MGIKKILALVLLLISSQAYSYINVSPLIFDERIDNDGSVKEYYVTNSLSHKTSYRIYLEKGKENDMSDWIEFYPKNLILNPGETGKLKLYIAAPQNTNPGEYTAILGIKEINTPNVIREGNLSIYTNLKIEIAGYVGDLKPVIEVRDFIKNNDEISMKVKNKGEIRTKLEIYKKNKKEEEYLGSIRLLKGDEKVFSTKISTDNKSPLNLVLRDLDGNLVQEIKEGENK